MQINGDPERCQAHVLSFAVPGLDSEALILACKDLVAISNGSACTSSSYQPSHVLEAMGLSRTAVGGTVRLSWSHSTELVPWSGLLDRMLSVSS